jgi:hypothetical protein
VGKWLAPDEASGDAVIARARRARHGRGRAPCARPNGRWMARWRPPPCSSTRNLFFEAHEVLELLAARVGETREALRD